MDVSRGTGPIAVSRVAALLAVVAAVAFGLELFVRASLSTAAFDTATAVLVALLLVAIYNSLTGFRTRTG
jgi:hypothetical protein